MYLTPTIAMELTNTREKDMEPPIYGRGVRSRHTYEQIHNKVLEIVFDKRPKPFPKNKATTDWVEQSIEPLKIQEQKSAGVKYTARTEHFKRPVSVQVRNDLEHRGRAVTSDDADRGYGQGGEVKTYL